MIPRYRAWHCELGAMMSIKNMWFQSNMLEELELNNAAANDYITAYPDEVELMQSTGLTDINDKEIFEGDILKVTVEHSWLEVVSFNENKAMFVSKEIKRETDIPESSLYDLFNTDIFKIEIIGNIYENPELLDGGNL